MATVPRRRSDFSAVGGAGAGRSPTKILTRFAVVRAIIPSQLARRFVSGGEQSR
jgi:hypothetical protein